MQAEEDAKQLELQERLAELRRREEERAERVAADVEAMRQASISKSAAQVRRRKTAAVDYV